MVGSLIRFLFTCCEESKTHWFASTIFIHFVVKNLHKSCIKIVRAHQPWSNLYIFILSDAQINILNKELESVTYWEELMTVPRETKLPPEWVSENLSKNERFFVRIFFGFPDFSGFLRIFADFNFLSQFFFEKDKFLFFFCKKIIYFFFYFWVFLLKSVQKKLSQFSKIPKVNEPESSFSFYSTKTNITWRLKRENNIGKGF